MSPIRRRVRLCAAVALCLAAPAGIAHGAVAPTRDAAPIAAAIVVDPALVTGASFVQLPPLGISAAVTSKAAARFPRAGGSYAILSTGNTGGTFGASWRNMSTDNEGGATHGDTSRDVTVLKIDVMVPAGANCLDLDQRFLSEEFPEFPGIIYNDGFVAELDVHDWKTIGSTVIAPHNFAFRTDGTPLNVRTSGDTSANDTNARGTVFDGATPLVRTSTPAAPGPHSLYLSLFDQGDATYDSAVLLDRLVARRARRGTCALGAFPIVKPDITLAKPRVLANGSTNFRARVSSESSIARVVVRLDGAPVYARTNFPDNERNFGFNVPIDIASLGRGTHQLTYVVVNRAGATTATRKFRR